MHLDVGLDRRHQVDDTVGAHAGTSRIVVVGRSFERWPAELGGKIGGVQLEYNSFEVLCRRNAVFGIPQIGLRFHHDLLYPFFVCLDGLEAHLRVGIQHPTANNFQGERDDAAKGFEIREIPRSRVSARGNIRLADRGRGWPIIR